MIDNIKLGKAFHAVDKLLASEEMKAVTKLMLMEKSEWLSPKGQSLGSMGLKMLVDNKIELPFIRPPFHNKSAKNDSLTSHGDA